MEEKILARIDELEAGQKQMQQEIYEMHQEISEVKEGQEQLHKELLDRQFVFEQEYGSKIDAIFDMVSIMKDKIYQVTDHFQFMDKRVDHLDMQVFAHEERIHRLEQAQS